MFSHLSLSFLLQSIWLEEGHVLVNPSHMLVYVRAVLRLVLAVDASEVAFLAMIAAESWMSYYGGVLGRETVRNGRTGAMGKAGPAIAVGHGSTWKNCYKIRRIKQAILVRAYSALINQRPDISIIHTHVIQTDLVPATDLEDILITVTREHTQLT